MVSKKNKGRPSVKSLNLTEAAKVYSEQFVLMLSLNQRMMMEEITGKYHVKHGRKLQFVHFMRALLKKEIDAYQKDPEQYLQDIAGYRDMATEELDSIRELEKKIGGLK